MEEEETAVVTNAAIETVNEQKPRHQNALVGDASLAATDLGHGTKSHYAHQIMASLEPGRLENTRMGTK